LLYEADDSFVNRHYVFSDTSNISRGSIKNVYNVTIYIFHQYTENLAKLFLCLLNLNLPFNEKKLHYICMIWGWGQNSLHLFLSSFLCSLLLEASITPFCTSVPESSFCKINGTIDKIKKYAYLLWGKKTRQIRVGFINGF